jgi:hypothetical protein
VVGLSSRVGKEVHAMLLWRSRGEGCGPPPSLPHGAAWRDRICSRGRPRGVSHRRDSGWMQQRTGALDYSAAKTRHRNAHPSALRFAVLPDSACGLEAHLLPALVAPRSRLFVRRHMATLLPGRTSKLCLITRRLAVLATP